MILTTCKLYTVPFCLAVHGNVQWFQTPVHLSLKLESIEIIHNYSDLHQDKKMQNSRGMAKMKNAELSLDPYFLIDFLYVLCVSYRVLIKLYFFSIFKYQDCKEFSSSNCFDDYWTYILITITNGSQFRAERPSLLLTRHCYNCAKSVVKTLGRPDTYWYFAMTWCVSIMRQG